MPEKSLRAALLAAAVATISGCMSSPADQLASIDTLPIQQKRTLQKSDRIDTQVSDRTAQSDIAAQAVADANMLDAEDFAPAQTKAVADQQENALVPVNQPRNISATRNSIFAAADTSTVEPSADPQSVALSDAATGLEPSQTLNAAQSSIYSGATDIAARDTQAIPLPDADKASEAQDLALAGLEVPPDPQLASADPVAADESSAIAIERPKDTAATRSLDAAMPAYDEAVAELEQKPAAKKRRLTLADFFRRKSGDDGFDEDRFGQKKKRLATSAIPNMKTAALSNRELPGVNAMMPLGDLGGEDLHDEDEDAPAGLMKLASIPGMTRIAPNGLWTQTDKVEVDCLHPQLVSMLKQVETHYKRPVVVTSGFRDPRHNRRAGGVRHSLHTRCAAADIQVEGVSKWQLSDYLRSIPGRGGVGTYCHTRSVHIDVGGERDWNWRCRRRSRRG